GGLATVEGKPSFFDNSMNAMLRIAIQKSGRLQEGSMKLLQESGLSIANGKDQLKTQARNFPVEVLFLRDDDIPQYIEDGVADAGIVGENILAETNSQVKRIEKLGFGRCRLALAVPRSFDYRSVSDLEGRRIATSYPSTLG